MKSCFLTLGMLISASVCAGPAPSASSPSVDLLLEHYSSTLTEEGVVRETRYQERMLRRDTHVWIERIFPAHLMPAASPSEHAHDALNPARMAQHIRLQEGRVQLEWINRATKEVIAIPPGEYGNAGFDGQWINHAYLFDPARLPGMQACPGHAVRQDARCYQERQKEGILEVWWNARLSYAESLSYRTHDRRIVRTLRAHLRPATATLPWLEQGSYAHREYSDFLD